MREKKCAIGNVYNRLTVLEELDPKISPKGYKSRMVSCKCNCGNKCIIALGNARSGVTKSCGCIHLEKSIKHGMTGTRIYKIWASMKERCDNSNYYNYERYGGRGISYDKKWGKFESFYHDIQKGYSDELTLDRINNDGSYCKDNCKRSTPSEQSRNRSTNRLRKGKCLADRCDELGLKYKTVHTRLSRGQSRERALELKT